MYTKALQIAAGRRTEVRQGLFELLCFPSISTDPAFADEVVRCTEWVAARLKKANFDVRLERVKGHENYPLLIAKNLRAGPGKPTILVYGHLDVQPPDPLSDWVSPPFSPSLRDGKIFARGAMDDKGQVWTHIAAVEAWELAGGLPCNFIFLLETQEESGGEALAAYLADPEKLKEFAGADVVVISDTAMKGPNLPALDWGLRGIVSTELFIRGPKKDLHSGVEGGRVRNPASVLMHVCSTCQGPDGRILIPGFYDGLLAPTPAELARMAEYPPDEAAILADTGVPSLWHQPDVSLAIAGWHNPTFELNGITAGYQGDGSKTIIPAQASAKISMRLGPGQDPRDIFRKFHAHLERVMPREVTWELCNRHGCPAFVCDPSGPAATIACRAMAETFGNQPELARSGGSIPAAGLFFHLLRKPVLLIGYAQPGSNIHSPNEWFGDAELELGTDCNIRFIGMFAEGFTAAAA